jgi:hypothetical protein
VAAHRPEVPVAERLLIALAVVLSLWVLLTTINIAREGWAAIPRQDDWDRWYSYFHDHYRLWFFFQQHVDHRLAAPRVLFLIDHLVFAARGWFLIICSFCIQALMVFLLLRLSNRAFQQDRTERIILAATVTAFLFSGQQWFNFILPFQVQFPMVYCAAIGALFALLKAGQRSWSVPWIAASIALATISTYSMANGLLLWPVFLLAAFWLRAPRRWIAVFTACTIVIGYFYIHHFHRAIVPVHLPESERPQRVAIFFLAQLGAPLSALSNLLWDSDRARLATTNIPGALVALALLAAFVMLWRRRSQHNAARAMLMFFCVFLAATSFLIAYGRSEDSPFDAFLSKYLAPPHILWATMLLVAWPLLRRIPRPALFAGLCAVMLFLIAIHQPAALARVRDEGRSVHLGEIAMANNVVDPEAWFWVSRTTPTYLETVDNMRTNHLALFTEEWTHWPGIPLLRRFSIDRNPDSCQGKFEEATVVPSIVRAGWRVSGWGWDNKAARSPRYIILGDEAGMVAGVALPGFPLPPALAHLPSRHVAPTWSGYVGGLPRPVTAYVLEADERSLCAIGTIRLHISGTEVGFLGAGPLLPAAAPEIVGGFGPDGYYKDVGGPGPAPVEGPVYGSFPDANQGSVRLGPFHLDGHTEILIPLVTGPDKSVVSIAVRDADTKEVLAQMSPPPLRTDWWAWRPDLPLDHEIKVEIVAEDKGSAWGQWIAVGWPHVLKK